MSVQLGQIDGAIVIESTEERLRQKLLQRDPQQRRPDDTTLAIENRLRIFKTETLSVIKHFDSNGMLTVVSLQLHCIHHIYRLLMLSLHCTIYFLFLCLV